MAAKRTLLQWLVISTDHPASTLANLFPEKQLLAVKIRIGNTRLPALCAGEAPNLKPYLLSKWQYCSR